MKPKLIVHEEARAEPWRERWEALTWEQRRRMTAAELILAMGPLHVNHAQFRAKPRSLLPMPNLAALGRQPVEEHHVTPWALIVRCLRWVFS